MPKLQKPANYAIKSSLKLPICNSPISDMDDNLANANLAGTAVFFVSSNQQIYLRFNLMEPFMRYSLFTTSSCTRHSHSAFIGHVITTMKIGTALFLATFGSALFIEMGSLALAEEISKAKELPRRVLRHTPSISKEIS